MSEGYEPLDNETVDTYGDLVDMLAPEIERRTGTDRRTLDHMHDIQRRERQRRSA